MRALSIDEKLAEAHYWVGRSKYYYDWDWGGAEKEFKRAIELDPNVPGPHTDYAYLLASLGRFDEALAEMKRANETEPDVARANHIMGDVFYWARRYDEAIEFYQKAITANPNSAISHEYLGFAYAQKSMLREATEEFQKIVPLTGRDAGAVASLGYGYALAGKRQDAVKIVEELKKGSERPFSILPSRVPEYRVAAIYAALGDKDRACEWLEKDYKSRGGGMVWLKVDPVMDPLRSDPRFKELARRMTLEQ